jgi:hypothetical protein
MRGIRLGGESLPQWLLALVAVGGYAKLHFFAFSGAFVLYVMNRLNNRQPFSLFAALNIDVGINGKPKTIFGDMIFSSMIGAIIVLPLTGPTTISQALAAGLGLTGILSAYSKSSSKEDN